MVWGKFESLPLVDHCFFNKVLVSYHIQNGLKWLSLKTFAELLAV